MVAGIKPKEPAPVDVAILAGSACVSQADVVHRLRAVLVELGGSMEPEDDPSLPGWMRAVEDVLRSAIRFLAATHCVVISANSWNILFLT